MSEEDQIVDRSPWVQLRAMTPARIALGRAGTSLPTAPHLDFQFAHARARKAVHLSLDREALAKALAAEGLETLLLESAAESRAVYLQRPDLGRRLSEEARTRLREAAGTAADVALVVGDGLSATAITANVVPFLKVLLPSLRQRGWTLAPVSLVSQARVAVGDEIGAGFGARMVVVLIGERPGLSSPDSMGIYMTYAPKPGLTDEARNCISNVRPAGLSYPEAAHKLLFLMDESFRRGLSGVQVKDEAETLVTDASAPRRNFLLPED